MAISTLQQDAFNLAPAFINQVNLIVKREAIYRNDMLPATPPAGQEYLVDAQRKLLGEVVKNPGSYGFAMTIVADNTWNLTYDPWAADPEAAKPTIEGEVQKMWKLLVGEVVATTP